MGLCCKFYRDLSCGGCLQFTATRQRTLCWEDKQRHTALINPNKVGNGSILASMLHAR